jgi:hypothetical protein
VDHSFGGELFAEGKQDSIITFTALNDSVGGWNGIYFHNFSDWQPGSISLLKYCTIQKGNQYNIWCNNTTQPTFENSTITQSAGYGLWLDAGSNVVKNSSIKNNNGHGVYMTGGSNPVIGNSVATGCDIYNNGGYNVYNNTVNNISMKYNYLGGCDSTYIKSKIWDKSNNSSLGRIAFIPTSCLPAYFNSSLAVNGRLYYNNSSSKPMRNAVISIKDYNDNTLASAQTSSQGNFATGSFNVSVPNKMVIIPADNLGGVNSTDALKIMRHFTQLELLASPYSFIADLNKSQTINGTDALMVLRRFAQIINSFPTGDLHLYSDSAFTDNSDFTYKLSALWFGDVNGSYTTLSKNSGVSLMYEGLLAPGSWTEFMMQIKIKNKTVIGAISLALNYPQECLEVLGVQLAKTGEDLLFTEQDGQMKMGWYSLAPVATDEEDVLLSIRFKAKDLRDQTKSICLTLSEGYEISDQNANELRGVILSAPVIQVPANGTGTGSDGDNSTTFSVYPNPVKENVQFSFDLPEPGYVILTVSDMPGRIVARVVNSDQDAGKQNIAFDISDLPGGVYFCHFKFTSNDRVTNITRKMIVE